ncbi:hypothetical protein [Streptomyces fructofermentans]
MKAVEDLIMGTSHGQLSFGKGDLMRYVMIPIAPWRENGVTREGRSFMIE